jgi:hypothetical protein
MNIQLIVAGILALLAVVVHGLGGELLVVRRLSPEVLSSSPFGGPRMTRAMIHVSWHLTTVAFFTVGLALVLAGIALEDDVARGAGLFAAATATGFAAVMAGLGAANVRTPRALLRHPAPVVFTAIAGLAWWGVL